MMMGMEKTFTVKKRKNRAHETTTDPESGLYCREAVRRYSLPLWGMH